MFVSGWTIGIPCSVPKALLSATVCSSNTVPKCVCVCGCVCGCVRNLPDGFFKSGANPPQASGSSVCSGVNMSPVSCKRLDYTQNGGG